VLSVSDLESSTRFYRDVLGLHVVARLEGTAQRSEMIFLRSSEESTNHHDLALIGNATASVASNEPPPGLFHVAFEVGTLDELEEMQGRLAAAKAFVAGIDQAVHLSVYGRDPDGIAVEILWRIPDTEWSYDDEMLRRPLDLDAARRRWGGLRTGAAAGVPA
jgi:catechol-2,3-dioxygenase